MRAARTVRPIALVVLLAAVCAVGACSEGVTPVCTPDAGCGPKPSADASASTEAPSTP